MTRLLRHIRANLVAYVALFVALGGTSYAAINLPANSVGGRQLRNHSITPSKFDRGSIAGYVRAYATIDGEGHVVSARPRAHIVGAWRTSGPDPGGVVSWGPAVSSRCLALATTQTGGSTTAAYASTVLSGTGQHRDVGAYVYLSSPLAWVSVAVICPQP